MGHLKSVPRLPTLSLKDVREAEPHTLMIGLAAAKVSAPPAMSRALCQRVVLSLCSVLHSQQDI